MLQGLDDSTQGRSKGVAHGEQLLDLLDSVRDGLLAGEIPRATLNKLAAAVTRRHEAFADPRLQDVLLRAYREDPEAATVCERFVDLDEGVQEWRYRHVKMVERTIGSKPGTGGSAGAEYLKETLFHPAFPDLWAIRALL